MRTPPPIAEIQKSLADADADGWLFYDFGGSDPIAYRILGLPATPVPTRRWYYLIPAAGEPRGLVSAVEPRVLDPLPGRKSRYRTAEEHRQGLQAMLAGLRQVAMQYSPDNQLPYVSRVDAGTIELVRKCGVSVFSSADLLQQFEAIWTSADYEAHVRAARVLYRTLEATLDFLASSARSGKSVSEIDLQQFMLDRIRRAGLETRLPPVAAIDAHTADPHYFPHPETAGTARSGSLILLDLWAKEPDGVYADITWMVQFGAEVDAEVARIFEIVRAARDRAVNFVRECLRANRRPRGCDVDAVARDIICRAGYGACFPHRPGHSLGPEVHGNGANIDGYETIDTRTLLPCTCFSIEPGVYLPGRFGVRSEVNVYMTKGDAVVTTMPKQEAIVPLLASRG